ncbi:cyclic AMP-dependent transcription factor ATF-6 alpha-like [Centruroides vittatus]|uniref:cyclic AMP-dependent transcription factor ATF-6 alpha-like n=1 Tax=Centruroides vittatus TaxID=120091 RepID=UPI00350F71F8
MAVDMLSLNEIDQKFLRDNMLTSEDLELDLGNLDFDLKNEDALFKENKFLLPENFDIESQIYSDICPSPLSVSNGSSGIDIKEEPPSPPIIQLQDQSIWSSEEFCPSIKVLDCDKQMEIEVPETPPNTPPGIQEVCTSPVPSTWSNTNPVITLVKTTVPNSTTVTVTPTVRIQPKKTTPIKVEKLPSAVQPLILRTDQLANLGILEISSAVNSLAKSPAPSELQQHKLEPITTTKLKQSVDIKPTIQGSTIPITAGSSTTALHNHYTDLKALKRQQRMIKNRESACLSRKKKKEYLQKLEIEVKKLTNENNRLRAENIFLKQRITDLEKGTNTPKAFLSNEMKKTTCFMAIIFMLTVNLAPYGGLLLSTNTPGSTSFVNPHRTGRSLLWKVNENVDEVNKLDPDFVDDSLSNNNLTGFEGKNISICPTYINNTESLRLENELRVWALRVEKQKRKVLTKKPKKVMPPVQAWINEARRRQLKNEWYPGHNELQIYRSPQKSFDDFLEAIHRREDTFYFVSFSGDHLLLPATAHNKTVRPKMSLVMPAMTFNDTVKHPKDHVTMMQIDCEVMNTKLVYVKESVIPPHLRHHKNLTKSDDDVYSIYKTPEKQRKTKSIKNEKQKHV